MKKIFLKLLIVALAMMSLKSQDFLDDDCFDDDPLPVCGGDGRTYQNPCYAEKALGGDSDIVIAYFGECVNCESCSGEYQPVCANDGKTYVNSCWADCKGVLVDSVGECRNQ